MVWVTAAADALMSDSDASHQGHLRRMHGWMMLGLVDSRARGGLNAVARTVRAAANSAPRWLMYRLLTTEIVRSTHVSELMRTSPVRVRSVVQQSMRRLT